MELVPLYKRSKETYIGAIYIVREQGPIMRVWDGQNKSLFPTTLGPPVHQTLGNYPQKIAAPS